MVDSMEAPPDIAVLWLSYILAPNTCKMSREDIRTLVKNWLVALANLNCHETRIIYLNPHSGRKHKFHSLWEIHMIPAIRDHLLDAYAPHVSPVEYEIASDEARTRIDTAMAKAMV